MSEVVFEGLTIAPNNGETLLDALLRHGKRIPNGCRSGICQSCIVIDQDNSISNKPQTGLTEQQKALGYFYSCSCIPSTLDKPAKIARAQVEADINATVIEKKTLNDAIFRLRLSADLAYKPGQFVTLWKDENVARSYSVASCPSSDAFIELHIKRYPGGEFSQWAFNDVEPGDIIALRGPFGRCFYTPENPQAPILLAGIGTGLAPLYGIVRDALHQGHHGPVYLVLGAKHHQDFYYHEELRDLTAKHSNFSVTFVSQDSEADEGDIYCFIKRQHPSMKGYKVFLCGADSFVKKMKKQSFLAGAAMGEIAADSFLAASTT